MFGVKYENRRRIDNAPFYISSQTNCYFMVKCTYRKLKSFLRLEFYTIYKLLNLFVITNFNNWYSYRKKSSR